MKTNEAKNELDELNLITLAQKYSDDDTARAKLESMRWPHGAICPHCKNDGSTKPNWKITPKADSKTPARNGLYKCAACRKLFSVTVGTIFESSHIKIGKWLMAIFILCSSKKSVSANQMSRMLDVQYKTAWFMLHRLRHGMSPESPLKKKLKGDVEVDETYVGGVGDRRTKMSRQTPVVALIERGGNMATRVVSNVTQKNLGQVLNECVSKEADVHTDEHTAYRNPLKAWKSHSTVVHSRKEYSRRNPDGTVSGINSCESFFSLLKRGVYGSWHHVSREHLPKYANEFAFRWNTRGHTDGERMELAVGMFGGKRLMYRQPVN
ncbi:MAG: IS1595 family transposase [Verrucomicrobiota bacterium]|jgi:transposase-like protein